MMGAILLGGTVTAQEVIPYSPSESWQVVYEDGRQERVSIADGSVFHVPGGARLDGVATFSQEIFAPEDQTLQIGVGADWFWRCRLNGRIVADHFTDGNRYAAINKGNHLVLLPVKRGRNLLEICRALLALPTDSALEVLGAPDNLKLRSSMTLFAQADQENPIFPAVLDKFFGGRPDRRTLALLGLPPR